jgi:hypothetical protein
MAICLKVSTRRAFRVNQSDVLLDTRSCEVDRRADNICNVCIKDALVVLLSVSKLPRQARNTSMQKCNEDNVEIVKT